MKNKKIGIFGGSFDPLHFGHVNSLKAVAEFFELDKIKVIPAFQSPRRLPIEGPSPEQRIEMLRLGLREFNGQFEIDDCEIKRGGISYTIDTIKELLAKKTSGELFLIIGMDQFEAFDQWKEYVEILAAVNLIVTTRPGYELPKSMEALPAGVARLAEDFDAEKVTLQSGKKIFFFELEDIEVSATEIRRRRRQGHNISDLVPVEVEKFINQHRLYEADGRKVGDFATFSTTCASILLGRGAIGVIAYDLRALDLPMEFSLICSGTSTRQASGLAENLVKQVKEQFGIWPLSTEGIYEGRWVVLDYGSLIVHVFYDYVRQEYKLEELWADGQIMPLPETNPPRT